MPNLNDMGGGTMDRLPGNFLLKEGCPLRQYSSGWEKPSIFKPLLSWDYKARAPMPWCIGGDYNELNEWVYFVKSMVRMAGEDEVAPNSKATFVVDCVDVGNYPTNDRSPYTVAYERVRGLKKDIAMGGMANRLLEGSASKGPPMPRPGPHVLLQATVYAAGDRNALVRLPNQKGSAPMPGCVMLLPTSAARSLRELLKTIGQQLPPADRDALMNRLFDPAGDLALMTISAAVNPPAIPGMEIVFDYAPPQQDDRSFPSARVSLIKLPPQAMANVPPPDHTEKHWRDWSSVVNSLTCAEQVAVMSEVFSPLALSVMFDTRSPYYELIPEVVRAGMAGGGNAYGPQLGGHGRALWPQQPGGYPPGGFQQPNYGQPPQFQPGFPPPGYGQPPPVFAPGQFQPPATGGPPTNHPGQAYSHPQQPTPPLPPTPISGEAPPFAPGPNLPSPQQAPTPPSPNGFPSAPAPAGALDQSRHASALSAMQRLQQEASRQARPPGGQ